MLKTEVLKKTEKIASAAYLVSGFFDDKEPLKWDIRTLSSRIVSKAAHVKDITADACELLALFSVARAAGLVSDTNYEIFSAEVEKLLSHAEKMPVNLAFSGLFTLEEPTPTSQPKEQLIRDRSSEPALLRPVEDKPKEKVLREFGAVAVKKNTRQSIIINLLKRKRDVMIKDISPLIEGVSEKTIQRELLSMVDQGIVRKEGEKRWSRYSLAN